MVHRHWHIQEIDMLVMIYKSIKTKSNSCVINNKMAKMDVNEILDISDDILVNITTIWI